MAVKQIYNLKQKQVPRLAMQTWLPLLQCSLSDLDKHIQNIEVQDFNSSFSHLYIVSLFV